MKHEIMPVFDGKSRILILGSFPSEASRKQGFYYGHPRNRFWRVISGVLGCETPETVDEKKRMLLSHGIALWDVIGSCTVSGSADSSIRDVVPNDLSLIFSASNTVSVSSSCMSGITMEMFFSTNSAWNIKQLVHTSRLSFAGA